MTDKTARLNAYISYALLLSKVWAGDTTGMLVKDPEPYVSGVLLGADNHGQRHLLVVADPDKAFSEQTWQNLELTEWIDPRSSYRYLDLVCKSDKLGKVFAQLVDDVLDRLTRGEHSPQSALLDALDEWRTLLKSIAPMSEDSARGLFGELMILEALAKRNPHYAVDTWLGPLKEVHDFASHRGAIEIKSSAKDGLDIVMSSLRQLDPPSEGPLTLVRMQIINSANGDSLPDLVNRILDAGVPANTFWTKLAEAGYIPGTEVDQWKFEKLDPTVAWRVGDDFPGLRSSDIPATRSSAITRVSYTLNLVSAGDPLDETQFNEALDQLVSAEEA